jgi:gamma-glutamylcyclotransferase (GGCT)/AIG2-like uncharacterized protein YtfP
VATTGRLLFVADVEGKSVSKRAFTLGVFVYGTLRRGGGLDPMVPARVPRRRAMVRGRLWLAPALGCYPVLTTHDADLDDLVMGEVLVHVLPWQLPDVDAMETGAGYERQMVTLTGLMWDTAHVTAWAYVWPPDELHGRRIESGDWLPPLFRSRAPLDYEDRQR